MKIFIVCNNLGAGGAERVAVNLANGFAGKGHEVYIVADSLNQKVSYTVDGSVCVMTLCRRSKSKIKWFGAPFRLRHYLIKEKPDVIIGFMHVCSIISRLATIGLKIPVVMTIHHSLESKEWHLNLLTQWLDKYTPIFYSAVTVLNLADKEYLGDNYKNVTVMPNPLTFQPVSKIPPKQKIILAAGRISNWYYKGFDLLIEAWGNIASSYPDWKLRIAGDGPKENFDYLEEIAKKCGIENQIDFMGYQRDMKSLYKEASIFVLSSRSEGLPMVLIEAMSQGCAPVACENLGRTGEIIQNSNQGLLYKTADINSMSEALSKMIRDEEYRHSVQKNAVARSYYYSSEKILCKWESLLTNLLLTKKSKFE